VIGVFLRKLDGHQMVVGNFFELCCVLKTLASRELYFIFILTIFSDMGVVAVSILFWPVFL
jgi:hypothetical protein